MVLDPVFTQAVSSEITECIKRALKEDIGPGDATTAAIVPADATMRGQIIAKQDGIVAGIDIVEATYQLLDQRVIVQRLVSEGEKVSRQHVLALISGPARALLTGERTSISWGACQALPHTPVNM